MQGEIETPCASCREPFEAPVWSFVNGGADENLRDQVKARELNLLLCPHCGAAFVPEPSIEYGPRGDLILSRPVYQGGWRRRLDADVRRRGRAAAATVLRRACGVE